MMHQPILHMIHRFNKDALESKRVCGAMNHSRKGSSLKPRLQEQRIRECALDQAGGLCCMYTVHSTHKQRPAYLGRWRGLNLFFPFPFSILPFPNNFFFLEPYRVQGTKGAMLLPPSCRRSRNQLPVIGFLARVGV